MLCKSTIFRRGQDVGRRLEIEGGGEFSLGASTIAVSFNPTWLILIVGTTNHGPRTGLWVSCER